MVTWQECTLAVGLWLLGKLALGPQIPMAMEKSPHLCQDQLMGPLKKQASCDSGTGKLGQSSAPRMENPHELWTGVIRELEGLSPFSMVVDSRDTFYASTCDASEERETKGKKKAKMREVRGRDIKNWGQQAMELQ